MRKHEYMINYWMRGNSDGTTCLFRTTSKRQWIEKIKECCRDFPIQNRYCKTIVWDDVTIFSFATGVGVNSWVDSVLLRRPLQVVYGLPKEVKE